MTALVRLFAILLVLAAQAVLAAEQGGQFSSARLDGGGMMPERSDLWAAVTIAVAPGWKTYWRNPGDAGIAPEFDWSGSINLASAEVVWPAPQRFFDGYSNSIGYTGPKVMLPVRIEPVDPARPVALSLTLRYAVCEVICVPETADLSGFVRSEPAGALAEELDDALARVPLPVETPGQNDPGVETATVEDGALEVTLNAFDGADEADIFGHGPSGEPLLLATRVAQEPRPVFRQPLDGLADEARKAGNAFTITVVWPGGAIEQTITAR